MGFAPLSLDVDGKWRFFKDSSCGEARSGGSGNQLSTATTNSSTRTGARVTNSRRIPSSVGPIRAELLHDRGWRLADRPGDPPACKISPRRRARPTCPHCAGVSEESGCNLEKGGGVDQSLAPIGLPRIGFGRNLAHRQHRGANFRRQMVPVPPMLVQIWEAQSPKPRSGVRSEMGAPCADLGETWCNRRRVSRSQG